jgi:hypothetical protein
VREGDQLTEVRYPKCPHCGHRSINDKPTKKDVAAIKQLEAKPIKGWYPKNKLYYPDGSAFKEKQQYESLDELFTVRNLQAVALVYQSIQLEKNSLLRKFLMGAFTSMVHLCTRMMPVGDPQPTNHYTYFSSPGWTQHSYWSASRYMEQNVWQKFESAVIGHQGLLNAKAESNKVIPEVKISSNWKDVLKGKADVAIINADCIEVMKEIPDSCVDYIFTDPPYDQSVQYGELSLLWNAWLKTDAKYGEKLISEEVVHNERQGKSFDVYHGLLSNSFQACHRILRPDAYFTLTFHNPTFKVRNATVRAAVFAGFDYQKIHHQPLGQVSAKSMIQPFGSAQGDFYLRFHKPTKKKVQLIEEVTEERFKRVVIETCREVIAERAEPTPYTILVNYVDPVLAKHGLFGTLHTGLDIKKVLQGAEGKDFMLVESKIGGATGKLWWFNDPAFVARLRQAPLTERVEQTVFRILRDKGKVTFTEVWDAVSREFPNSLTSDSTSIKEALEIYGRKVGSLGHWMLREEVRERIRSHSEIIALIARIGRKRGYDIWIGKPEQGAVAEGVGGGVPLSTLVTARPKKLNSVKNLKDVLLMDALWLSDDAVVCAFEVESTTTMTSALQRGSNLPPGTPKIMALPEERKTDFDRKMESPLFKDSFLSHSWNLLFFDKFREAYLKTKDSTKIEELLGLPAAAIHPDRKKSKQHQLPFS